MQTENNNIYKKLFSLLKDNQNDEFIKTINNIMNNGNAENIFDINAIDEYGKSFLNYAVVMKNIKIVDFLIKKNIKIDIENDDISILTVCIYYNYDDILKLLLEANKKSIGLNLINYRDKNHKTPLHHAIIVKNIYAIQLLIEYGSNVDLADKDKYNALFYAIKSRSYEITKMIIECINNINAKCHTGENALHFSCSLQLYDISDLLIKYNIDINVHDYNEEITPLHYCVILNNAKLVKLLLDNGANLNLQDVYGNTSLHYSIIENNVEIFNMLLNHGKNNINLNLWNIDGEIPLHKAILREEIQYVDKLVEKSNLNIQDKYGNSCLCLLIKFDLWKNYIDILKYKKLNVFLKNKTGEYVFSLIQEKDKNMFFDMLSDSYIHTLKNENKNWTEEWDIICKKNISELNEEETKKVKKSMKNKDLNDGTFLNLCKNVIIKKILSIINNIANNNLPRCYERSYPIIRPPICVELSEGKKLNFCSFTGNLLDILIGLVYLINKHKKETCSILSQNIDKKDLCMKYKLNDIILNNKCELVNFEIIWSNKKLFLDNYFINNFVKCMSSNKRFIIIPIGIEMKEGSHAGYLIYDSELKELERFETYGGVISLHGTNYDAELLDEKLENKFKEFDENIKYIKPYDYLPKISFQILDIAERKKKKIGDPMGFCALWAIWYVDNRITYRDIPREKLIKFLFSEIKSKSLSFKDLIRNYATNIIEIRDEILSKANLDINDWINENYTEEQFISILDEINIMIKKI